ncbi:ribonuclease domain-containing protein [Denitromonas iodatirespirans]|uniref:Ribonuclease n=1 Tax=Denitromonas iodatirespirans TaxID=2795389 RepID=A0A944D5Y0_DENI1|nr:ribonuclease domain-containing protein [Denitromonas iodatirespirans]MBT0960570.1 ribonuclease [Denitromonas iodatirespirans]
MHRLAQPLLIVLLALFALLPACSQEPPAAHSDIDWLPAEALDTLARIERGGPFPYAKDGTIFFNREKRLPAKPRGYYREYTVPTPGERSRGARRIVAGGNPPDVYYYTADHYRSFRRIPEAR